MTTSRLLSQTVLLTAAITVAGSSLFAPAFAPAWAATVSVPSGALLVVPNPNLRTITIDIDDAANVEAALFRIQYNRSIAVATAVRSTVKTANCFMESNLDEPTNEVQISMACTGPLSGDGPMFEIDFAGTNSGLTDLTFLECKLNEGAPVCNVDNGDLRVSTCALDVDADGSSSANTDGVYLFRALPPTLQTIVPTSFRDFFPNITADSVILDNIAALESMLDIDDRGGAQANTDGVYLFRALPPALQTIVPELFRDLDPSIPSDNVIQGNIDAICP